MPHLATKLAAAMLLTATASASLPANATDITTEWATIKIPPAPELKPITVDPKTTALLVLDFMKTSCGRRPRCIATIPAVKKMLDTARANNMLIAFNLTGQNPKIEDMIDPVLYPKPGEHIVIEGKGGDKFLRSSLEPALKARGIKTVIVTGTSAQGAVATTSNGATQRGFKAVVPVDGMSAEDAFNELYAAWHLAKGGPVALVENVTLTRSDLIKYGN